jgi:hypothetical protein
MDLQILYEIIILYDSSYRCGGDENVWGYMWQI